MDAQEMHDQRVHKQPLKVKDSKAKLKALLEAKNGSSLEPKQSTELDPIAQAIKDNPSLTPEKALEMAEKLGF